MELFEVARLHMAETNDIGGNVRSPRIGRTVHAGLCQGQRPLAVILQRDGNRADRLAFAQQIALRQIGSSDIVLYLSCELQGLVKT